MTQSIIDLNIVGTNGYINTLNAIGKNIRRLYMYEIDPR